MYLMDILNYCRQHSNLSAMQVNMLYQLNTVLPLVADLAHGHVAVYIKTKKDDAFIVMLTAKPHCTLDPYPSCTAGKHILQIEEPLIEKTMRYNKKYQGKREVQFGKFIDTYTIPIVDDERVIAVITFEITPDESEIPGFSRLLKTAFTVLKYSRKNLNPDMYKSISSRDGVIIANSEERIIFANEMASRIYHVLGISNLLGCHTFDRQLTMHITKETILQQSSYEKELDMGNLVIIRRDIPIREAGNLLTRIIILSDVTEIRKKDKELLIKSAVIQEIHHRVKNNLQMIASLLRLQARRSKSQEVRDALKESVNRILSISVAHEFLSQQGADQIDVMAVTKSILKLVQQNMLDDKFELTTEFSGEAIILPSKQASNLAIIINELVLNSIEHGFEHRHHGMIGLSMKQSPYAYVIELYNDGEELPDDFNINKARAKSLGLQIITTMVEGDWGGKFELLNNKDVKAENNRLTNRGTLARITIPYNSMMEEDENG